MPPHPLLVVWVLVQPPWVVVVVVVALPRIVGVVRGPVVVEGVEGVVVLGEKPWGRTGSYCGRMTWWWT